jgi:1-acyl-sn-glycerol-3-phosphate acyltransferase
MTDLTSGQRRALAAFARYFRLELTGAPSELPAWRSRPCIFVMNHTALLGVEVYLFHAAMARARPDAPRVRTTVWPPFLEVPVLGSLYRAGGCLPASVEGAVACLRRGESVLILPEGPDATDVRHEVGPFHAGFLRVVKELAGELDVPVVPIGWYGVDEANPWFVTTQPLLVQLLMKPAMPRFEFALVPRPPLLRPSKVVMAVGQPLRFGAEDLATEARLREQVQRVRDQVIGLIAEARALRASRIASNLSERVLAAAFGTGRIRWSREESSSVSAR